MEKSEITKALAMIRTFYPSSHKQPDDERDLIALVNAWHMMLHDVSATTVFTNLNNHIKHNKFPPAIADLTTPITRMPGVDDNLQLPGPVVQTESVRKAREEALREIERLRAMFIFGGEADE